MIYFTHKNFFIVLALFALFPFVASASEIRLEASKVEVRTGEQFVVTAFMSADESLNAVEGRLVFPQDLLSVKEIRDGNSVINFWVEKPRIEASGIILFSGITPGGFSGANNGIFSVVFEAKNTGVASIILQGTKALENDGLGSQTALLTRDTAVSIKSGDSNVRKETLTDTELPEDFNPSIESDPSIFGGKFFLVFATQDKISGIANYKIREGEWSRFTIAESPYLLKHQSLDRNIFVKAIDKNGNERIAVLNVQHQAPWYRQYAVLGILLAMVLVGFLLKKVWSRFTK